MSDSKTLVDFPTVKPKLTDTGSCFIDVNDEKQIAEILEDSARETKEITETISNEEEPVEGQVLEAQLLELIGESRRLNDLVEDLTTARDMLLERLKEAHQENKELRDMIEGLTRKISSLLP